MNIVSILAFSTCPSEDWWERARQHIAIVAAAAPSPPPGLLCGLNGSAVQRPPWTGLKPLISRATQPADEAREPPRGAHIWTHALSERPWEWWLALQLIFEGALAGSTLLVGKPLESARLFRCHLARHGGGGALHHEVSLESPSRPPKRFSIVVIMDGIAGLTRPWLLAKSLPAWVAPGGSIVILSRTLVAGTAHDSGFVPMPAALPNLLELSGLRCGTTSHGQWGTPTVLRHILSSCHRTCSAAAAANVTLKAALYEPAYFGLSGGACVQLWPLISWLRTEKCWAVADTEGSSESTSSQNQLDQRLREAARGGAQAHKIYREHQSDVTPGNLPVAALPKGNVSGKATRQQTELIIAAELRRRRHQAGRVLFISGAWEIVSNLGRVTQATVANYPAVKCDSLPYANGSFDTYMANQVFEHVTMPWRCIDEAFRVLAPNGLLVIASPAFYQQHGWPSDFWRFHAKAFPAMAASFTNVVTGTWGTRRFIEVNVQSPTLRVSPKLVRAAKRPNDASYPFASWMVASKP